MTLYHLAQGDILKIEAITALNIRSALTFLCYELDLHISKRNKMPDASK